MNKLHLLVAVGAVCLVVLFGVSMRLLVHSAMVEQEQARLIMGQFK
ncbi:hypothetical protein PQR14_36175 [Paraburkholderia bryophila]